MLKFISQFLFSCGYTTACFFLDHMQIVTLPQTDYQLSAPLFVVKLKKKRAPQVSAFRFLTPSKDMQNTGTALCSLFDWDFASIRYRAVCLCLSATVELELYFVIWCICSLGRLGGFLCLSLTLSTSVLLAAAYQTGSTWCSLTAHTHVQHKNDLSWIYTFIAQLNLDLITF